MNIMLACALGMSTGMLVERMRDSAKNQGKDYKIWAVDIGSIASNEDFDILLLGPQVAFEFDNVNKKYGAEKAVAVIKPVDYGRMNGKAVLAMAEELYQDKK